MKNESKELYENDYYGWLLFSANQAKLLGLAEITDHLEEMGRSERRALGSKLEVLIMHLLKWKYQPDNQSKSWRVSINYARKDIEKYLKESPSLKPKVYEIAKDRYDNAVLWAVKETDLEKTDFPAELEFSLEELLNVDFLPNLEEFHEFQSLIKNLQDEDDLYEMTNLFPRTTKLPLVIWISPKGKAKHGPRIKAGPDRDITITIEEDPRLIHGSLKNDEFEQIKKWILLNKETLLKHWNNEIDGFEVSKELKSE